MKMVGRGTGRSRAAMVAICLTVGLRPGLAQPTDGSRPGDLFSFDQIGKGTGQK
jgi:hypothetical protein